MHQLRVVGCRRRANILGQVRGGVPVAQPSAAEEQQPVADQQSVAQHSAPEELQPVAQPSAAEEQESVAQHSAPEDHSV